LKNKLWGCNGFDWFKKKREQVWADGQVPTKKPIKKRNDNVIHVDFGKRKQVEVPLAA